MNTAEHPWRLAVRTALLAAAAQLAFGAETSNDINAADLYKPVVSNLSAWRVANVPPTELLTTNFFSTEAAGLYDDMLPLLRGLATARGATTCDWHSRYEDGHRVFGETEDKEPNAVMMACWATRYAALHDDMGTCCDIALDTLRLARYVGAAHDSTALLLQTYVERDILQTLVEHTDRLTPEQKSALQQGMASLPPGTNFRDAILTDRALLIANYIEDLRCLQTSAPSLFLPDGEVPEADGTASATPAPSSPTNADSASDSWLTENVRMSALIDTGSGLKIGLELKSGESFFLELGQRKYDIRLLSLDDQREEAVIARKGETALIRLKDREIRALHLGVPLHPLRMSDQELEEAAAKTDDPRLKGALMEFKLMGPDERARAARSGRPITVLLDFFDRVMDEQAQIAEMLPAVPPDQYRAWWDSHSNEFCRITNLIGPLIYNEPARREYDVLKLRTELARQLTPDSKATAPAAK